MESGSLGRRALKKCLSVPFNNSSLHIVTILYGYVQFFCNLMAYKDMLCYRDKKS